MRNRCPKERNRPTHRNRQTTDQDVSAEDNPPSHTLTTPLACVGWRVSVGVCRLACDGATPNIQDAHDLPINEPIQTAWDTAATGTRNNRRMIDSDPQNSHESAILPRRRSITNGPNGITAATIPCMANFSGIGTRRIASKNINTRKTNKAPCTLPTMVTAIGMLPRYFKGMAIPKSTSVEMPSQILTQRSHLRNRVLSSGGVTDALPRDWLDRLKRLPAASVQVV